MYKARDIFGLYCINLFGIILLLLMFCAQDINNIDGGVFDQKKESHHLQLDILTIDESIKDFMDQYHIPGASIAISKDERLVYAKGYGFANKNKGTKVSSDHLFRVASISKLITSIAIMKLIQEEAISLDDKVFGVTGVLGSGFNLKDPRIEEITIQNLLQHTSGGWGNNDNDPMFTFFDYDQNQLIAEVLATRTLEYAPGTHYAYSNFGYCILGRVIEKLTGDSYASYVNRQILFPLGIVNMYLAENTESEKYPDEVNYYSQAKNSPYGMNIRRMDSHGGWIASASDLLKLLIRVDGLESKPDILTPIIIDAMTSRKGINPGYALGWQVNKENNWWHTGCLPGTGALIVRTQEGLSWTILVNSRSMEKKFFYDMDRTMWKAVKSVDKWPDIDLFKEKIVNTSLPITQKGL